MLKESRFLPWAFTRNILIHKAMRFKTPEEDLAEKCPDYVVPFISYRRKVRYVETAASEVFVTKYDFAVSNNKRHRHNIAQRKLLQ